MSSVLQNWHPRSAAQPPNPLRELRNLLLTAVARIEQCTEIGRGFVTRYGREQRGRASERGYDGTPCANCMCQLTTSVSNLEHGDETMSQGTQTSTTNQQQLVEERWKSIRSKLKSQWSELSDQDLSMIDGDSRKLVAMVSQKTHQPIHEIEAAIDKIASESGGLLSRLTEQVSEMASAASHAVTQPVSQYYRQARQAIRHRPVNSVAAAFGVGILVGLLSYALACDDH